MAPAKVFKGSSNIMMKISNHHDFLIMMFKRMTYHPKALQYSLYYTKTNTSGNKYKNYVTKSKTLANIITICYAHNCKQGSWDSLPLALLEPTGLMMSGK